MATSLAVLTDTSFSQEKIELIKRTIAVGVTDDELQLFLYASKKTGLDPLTRQIYAIKRFNKQAGRDVMTIQTGIDGYRVIADRTGKLAGISDASFDDESGKNPGKASVTVRKVIDGGGIADFTATARWSEYVQTYKDGNPSGMWVKMPFLMLGKCAEALALRKAFPADLSGVYTAEEMAQADNASQGEAVFAEVDRQKAARPTLDASTAGRIADSIEKVLDADLVPPELDWMYQKSSGVLICRPMDVKKSKKKNSDAEFVSVKLNNSIDGKNVAFYFHSSHADQLMAATGKVCKFMVIKSGDFTNIDEVLEIDGKVMERDASKGHETEARLLASVLEFSEEDIRELHGRYCGGSWTMVLEKLKEEKVRRQAEASREPETEGESQPNLPSIAPRGTTYSQ